MPIRHAALFRRLNDEPPVEVKTGGITQIRAALRKQLTFSLRDDWRIRTDNGDDGVVLVKGGDTLLIYIEAEPLQHRAPGGGRKQIAAEPTVRVTVSLLPEQIASLTALGDGNLSAGIRRLFELARQWPTTRPSGQ